MSTILCVPRRDARRDAVRIAAVMMAGCALVLCGSPVSGHGFVGQRFFPATLAVDDPFVADELSLPTFERRKMPGSGDEAASTESAWTVDYTKRITRDFGIGVGTSYRRISAEGADRQSGFDNLALSAKYQLWQSEVREAIVSVGIDWDVGGSGAKRIGAESFSTITPGLFFGKGFGDLPSEARLLRPLALTGSIGVAFPTRASTRTVSDEGEESIEQHPNVLQWGFTLQYSVPYLQSAVADLGWREPFNRLIPVVEFAMESPLNRGRGGTTGTVNPGLLWVGRYMQLGIEAVIPVNDRSGHHTGVLAQLHFYLDDLFPRSIGKPLLDPR
ncbi:MAG TPA: hypothetical protein VFB54_13865 [Burkholderiales bacterium]|nr:hypothetical protein [Burkholderiales bacterium]